MENKKYSLTEVKTKANDFLNNKKDVNETTFLNYRTSFNYFIYYLTNISKEEYLGTDNKEMIIEGFQGSLFKGFKYKIEDNERTVKAKANGVNTHVRRIKTFLNKSLGLKVDSDSVKDLKVTKPKYKSLSKEEIELLIKECSNKWKNEEIAVRTSTLIRFLFNTAFRIEEALGILTSNIYEDGFNYYVKIQEKGKAKGELTEVAISENTFNLINDYINLKKVPSDYVFSSTKPSAELEGKSKKYNRENFNKAIRDLASYVDLKYKGTKINDKPVNISKTVANNSSHVFRHSKATYLLNVKKEDVVTVKEILRHNSIDSTLIYLNPEEEAINKVRISNDI